MYTDMDWWTKIRLEVSREESSKRGILRREGISWDTLKKILAHPEPPGYRLKEPRPKRRSAPTLSGLLKSSKKTRPYRRNNATPPSGSTTASGGWATREDIPR